MSAVAPGLSRKVKKCLQIDIESPELHRALQSLSGIYTENTAQNRRELKSTVASELVAANRDLLTSAQAFVNVRTGILMKSAGLSLSGLRTSAAGAGLIHNLIFLAQCTATVPYAFYTYPSKPEFRSASKQCRILRP